MRPETSLHFVEDQERVMLPAKVRHGTDVFDRREVRPDALVGFHHHARDLVRLQPTLLNGAKKSVEARIGLQ